MSNARSMMAGVISANEAYTREALAQILGVSTDSVERWLNRRPRLRPVEICRGCYVYAGHSLLLRIQDHHGKESDE